MDRVSPSSSLTTDVENTEKTTKMLTQHNRNKQQSPTNSNLHKGLNTYHLGSANNRLDLWVVGKKA